VREIRDYLCTITAARSVLQLPVHNYCRKECPPITCALLSQQEELSSSYQCTITTARTLLQLHVHYNCLKTLLQLPVHNYCRKKESSPITCALLLPQEELSSNYLCTITAARRTLLQLPVHNYYRKKDSSPVIQLSNRRTKQTDSRFIDMRCRKHIHSFEDSRLLGCYRIDC